MESRGYQVIGRRLSQPQTLIFRDPDGRHFLRAGCGTRLVRVTARDAMRLMRSRDYHSVLDRSWRSETDAIVMDCPLPDAAAPEVAGS